MAQSVKLSNGDYLDTSGIYDTSLGMTQEEVNNGEVHTIDITAYDSTNFTKGTIKWIKLGKMVYVSMLGVVFADATQKQVVLSMATLGMPTPQLNSNVAGTAAYQLTAVVNATSSGELQIWKNSGASTLYVSFCYIAAD